MKTYQIWRTIILGCLLYGYENVALGRIALWEAFGPPFNLK